MPSPVPGHCPEIDPALEELREGREAGGFLGMASRSANTVHAAMCQVLVQTRSWPQCTEVHPLHGGGELIHLFLQNLFKTADMMTLHILKHESLNKAILLHHQNPFIIPEKTGKSLISIPY